MLAPAANEYQTSQLLYDVLLSHVSSAQLKPSGSSTGLSGKVDFSGSYAIVSSGVAVISVQRRVELVARELRDRLRACEHRGFECVYMH